jgi:hypothetical protein
MEPCATATERAAAHRARWTGDMLPERRAITPEEAEVIRAALERASVRRIDDAARVAVPALTVVAKCECGCASVDFDAPPCEERATLVADGTAQTSRGGQVGVIVWGRPDAITGLEIYDLGGRRRRPRPSSLSIDHRLGSKRVNSLSGRCSRRAAGKSV